MSIILKVGDGFSLRSVDCWDGNDPTSVDGLLMQYHLLWDCSIMIVEMDFHYISLRLLRKDGWLFTKNLKNLENGRWIFTRKIGEHHGCEKHMGILFLEFEWIWQWGKPKKGDLSLRQDEQKSHGWRILGVLNMLVLNKCLLSMFTMLKMLKLSWLYTKCLLSMDIQ